MTRVLHVIASVAPRHGGASQALVGLAIAQHRHGMAVTIVTDDKTEDAKRVNELQNAGLRILNLSGHRGPEHLPNRCGNRLTPLVREVDVVHIHGVWERLIHEAATTAEASRVPVIIRSCGMLDERLNKQLRFLTSLDTSVTARHLSAMWATVMGLSVSLRSCRPS